MMRRFICLLSFVLLLGFASNTLAANCWWGDGAMDQDYSNWQNWWHEGVGDNNAPGPADTAAINIGGDRSLIGRHPIFSAGSTMTVSSTLIGFWNPGRMDMTGGDLTNTGTLAVGYAGGTSAGTSHSQLNISGGNLYAEWMWCGSAYDGNTWRNDGKVVMTGGTLTVGGGLYMNDPLVWGTGPAPSSGFLDLYVGTVTLNDLYMLANDTIRISAATLDLPGIGIDTDDLAVRVLSDYVTNGYIVAGTGRTLDVAFYDNGDDGQGIIITAIPEPMTIALLGLGGLFLRRRKR